MHFIWHLCLFRTVPDGWSAGTDRHNVAQNVIGHEVRERVPLDARRGGNCL